MNIEPVDIDHDANQGLNHTDNQQRDVMAPLPETPAERSDDDAGHDSKEQEAGDMIPVGDVVATNRSRRQQMPGQTSRKKYYAEPNPAALHWVFNGGGARLFDNISVVNG